MSDYSPDEFGDFRDEELPELPPEYSYEGRLELGDGSIVLDIYVDFSRESFLSDEDISQLRDIASLPDFVHDTFVDTSQIDPSDIQPGESWTTGPFDSPDDAWQWAQEMGVAGFSDWYEDEDGDVWLVIDRDSGSGG